MNKLAPHLEEQMKHIIDMCTKRPYYTKKYRKDRVVPEEKVLIKRDTVTVKEKTND